MKLTPVFNAVFTWKSLSHSLGAGQAESRMHELDRFTFELDRHFTGRYRAYPETARGSGKNDEIEDEAWGFVGAASK